MRKTVAVVAIRFEARREVARERELLRQSPQHQCDGTALLIRSVIPRPGTHPHLRYFRRAGNHVHHAADRIGTIKRGSRPVQDLHAIHHLERQRQVEVVVSALSVVESKSIQQHQRLPKRAAAYGDIGLHAIRRPASHVDGRVQPHKSNGVATRSRSGGDSGKDTTERSDSSSGTGSKVPVTTTVSARGGRTVVSSWAQRRRGNSTRRNRNYKVGGRALGVSTDPSDPAAAGFTIWYPAGVNTTMRT